MCVWWLWGGGGCSCAAVQPESAILEKKKKIKLIVHISAVYTFVHSGFSWEVARQLPLNTAKHPNRKTHLRSRMF